MWDAQAVEGIENTAKRRRRISHVGSLRVEAVDAQHGVAVQAAGGGAEEDLMLTGIGMQTPDFRAREFEEQLAPGEDGVHFLRRAHAALALQEYLERPRVSVRIQAPGSIIPMLQTQISPIKARHWL